jgi:hypothetical protein
LNFTVVQQRRVAAERESRICCNRVLISQCLICSCLFTVDAVRMNDSMSSVLNEVVEDKIKIWLRQARDREGERKRRFLASASKVKLCGETMHLRRYGN